MGVQGLLPYVKTARDLVADTIDLLEESKKEDDGIEILCDFYAFEHFILDNFYKAIVKESGHRFVRHLGGEYKSLAKYVETFITHLRNAQIRLVMYVDATQGVDKTTTELKFGTWKQRHYQGIVTMNKILECIAGMQNIYDLADEDKIRPVCLEIQIQETLRENEIEFIYVIDNETNELIALDLQNRPKAFAVLSNDSDFCIFKNCKFIPFEFFDLDHDMEMGYSPLPCKPLKLNCGIVSASKLAKCLQLQQVDHLMFLAMILPSNFMGAHHAIIKKVLTLPENCSLLQAAAHIRFYGNPLGNKSVLTKLNEDSELKQGVERTIKFFSLTLHESKNDSKSNGASEEDTKESEDSERPDEIDMILCERVSMGQIDSNLLAIHRGYFWYRLMLEDNSKGSPVCEEALSCLRQVLYNFVLPDDATRVKEFGRAPFDLFQMRLRSKAAVTATIETIPTVNEIKLVQIFKNLKYFHILMSFDEKKEGDSPANYFDKYGRKFGFLCYILRFFLLLNYQRNLSISLEEFLACAAMVLHAPQMDETKFRSYRIVPSVRSVTVGTWFQIYC
ncbi:DgyrCDS1973 [Dimorphilus gyrociliatus]|uniref:DgyrCDS1973 n=1 Tax=Dimorphilus gyrociliatus TaxID=2664684 RepID=A0A7I8VAV4_9ANNE|nr:DgyrCDS1973 [Dimorphilus gyrociliatus]